MDGQYDNRNRINWSQVGLFLGLTFTLSWAINFVLWRTVGYGSNTPTLLLLQAQMLVPAFSALFLERFFFKNSPLFVRRFHERPRWFVYFFYLFTVAYLLLAVLALALPGQAATFSALGAGLAFLGILVLIGVRGFGSRESFKKAGLSGGRFVDWLLYGGALVAFYALQAALNRVFGLGEAVDLQATSQALTQGELSPGVFLLLAAFNTILIGPFLGLLFGFGEEYGWRVYLQRELVKLGRVRGITLLGVIWGIWHYPVILMGHNYPGYPVAGLFLMTGYTLVLGFVLGYVMLKTGAVWLVAWLHALNNQTLSFFNSLVYQPDHPVFSFGTGLYGLAVGALVVGIILLDPIWREGPGMPVGCSEETHPVDSEVETPLNPS